MTNSCFCRRPYNLVGLFENERLPNLPVHFSLHCPLLFHFFSLSPLLRDPLKQSSPLVLSFSKCKDVPKGSMWILVNHSEQICIFSES